MKGRKGRLIDGGRRCKLSIQPSHVHCTHVWWKKSAQMVWNHFQEFNDSINFSLTVTTNGCWSTFIIMFTFIFHFLRCYKKFVNLKIEISFLHFTLIIFFLSFNNIFGDLFRYISCVFSLQHSIGFLSHVRTYVSKYSHVWRISRLSMNYIHFNISILIYTYVLWINLRIITRNISYLL